MSIIASEVSDIFFLLWSVWLPKNYFVFIDALACSPTEDEHIKHPTVQLVMLSAIVVFGNIL